MEYCLQSVESPTASSARATIPPGRQSKLFVLDTNVVLHDCHCIRNFADNDVAVPITVLEELDSFKRGNEDINFQAREFLRQLDVLTGDASLRANEALLVHNARAAAQIAVALQGDVNV